MTTPGPLAGKHALVTGGARGIGAGIVRAFAGAGATGHVLDRSEPGELATGWTSAHLELRDDASIQAAFAGTDPVDVLVAAAGIVPGWSDTASADLNEWDDVQRVNARGVMATIQRALPRMPDGAAIVVVASLTAWRGDPNLASYVASKHATMGIVRSTALDLGRRGIRVNAVAPGPIATEALLQRAARREQELGIPAQAALDELARGTALNRIATVDEVASATLFLASDLASGITGHLLPVDGGIT